MQKKSIRKRKEKRSELVRKAFALTVIYLLIASLISGGFFPPPFFSREEDVFAEIAGKLNPSQVNSLEKEKLALYIESAGNRPERLQKLSPETVVRFLKEGGRFTENQYRVIKDKINPEALEKLGQDIIVLQKAKILTDILKKNFGYQGTIQIIQGVTVTKEGKLVYEGKELDLTQFKDAKSIKVFQKGTETAGIGQTINSEVFLITTEYNTKLSGKEITDITRGIDGTVKVKLQDGTEVVLTKQDNSVFTDKQGNEIRIILGENTRIEVRGFTITAHGNSKTPTTVMLINSGENSGGITVQGAQKVATNYEGKHFEYTGFADNHKVDFLNKGDTLKSDGHGKEVDLKVYIGDKADATKKTSEGSIENIRYLNGQIAELSTIKVFSVNLEQPEDKKLTFRSKDGKPLPVYFIDVDSKLAAKVLTQSGILQYGSLDEAAKKLQALKSLDPSSPEYKRLVAEIKDRYSELGNAVIVAGSQNLLIMSGKSEVDTFIKFIYDGKDSKKSDVYVKRTLTSNDEKTVALYDKSTANGKPNNYVFAINGNANKKDFFLVNEEIKYFNSKGELMTSKIPKTVSYSTNDKGTPIAS